MKEIKLYKSSWKAIRLILMCSVFVLIGLWLNKDVGTSKWLIYAIIIFFGLGVCVGIFHLFDKRPQIIITEVGIFDRTTHKDFINWEIIQNAYLITISKQKFICLIVDEAFKPSKTKNRFYRQVVKTNVAIGAQDLNINLGQIDVNAEKLTEFIFLMCNATKTERNNFLISHEKSF